jgi:hypothetical protein
MTTTHPDAPEQRTIDVDVESIDTRGRTLHGYAAVYGVESHDLGGFRERIAPGAFAAVMDADVRCLLNHDPSQVLGRSKSGTLRLSDEQRGLRFECDLPDSPLGENVRAAVKRGDLDGASFRFKVGEEDWDGELRTVRSVAELHDVTVATYGAYPDASVELRTRPQTSPIGDTETSTTVDTNAAERQEDNNMTETTLKEAPEAAERTEERAEGGLQVEERTEAAPSTEQRVIEALREVRKGETRSLTTSSASAIAPPELSSYLFDKLRASSVALQSGIRVIPTEREKIEFPKLSTDVDPDWYGETDTITPGDPTLVTLTATPHKLAHIVQLSNELIDDSEPSIVDVLNGHLATVLGLKLDAAIYEGAGVGDEPTGLANTEGVQEGEAPDDYDAFVKAVGMLQEVNAPGPYVVAGPPEVFTDLALLKAGKELNTQLGAPAQMPTIYVSTQLTNTFVYAPSPVVLVRRQDAAIELDRSRLFNQDMSELRGKLRADVLLPNPAAVVVLPNSGS